MVDWYSYDYMPSSFSVSCVFGTMEFGDSIWNWFELGSALGHWSFPYVQFGSERFWGCSWKSGELKFF